MTIRERVLKLGTSKRKQSIVIKKMLEENRTKDITETIPQATSVVLNEKVLLKELGKEVSLRLLINAGVKGLEDILSDGQFDGIPIDKVKNNEEIQHVFLERLIEFVEEQSGEDLSELILKSFRLAIVSVLNEEKGANEFISEFAYHLIYFIVQHEVLEVFSDFYLEISHDEINNLIKTQSRNIVSTELTNEIIDYISGKLELSKLIKFIVQKADTVKIGEF